MSYLQGMTHDRGCDGFLTDEDWASRPSDMRAREEFRVGYLVRCPGVSGCLVGQVMEIDADERLAKVGWMSGKIGWWYLKDLKVIGISLLSNEKSITASQGLAENARGIPAERRLLVKSKEVPAHECEDRDSFAESPRFALRMVYS